MKWQVKKNQTPSWIILLLLAIGPLLVWWGALSARPHLILRKCTPQVAYCSPSSLFKVDQLSLGSEIPDADGYSYATQNLSGILAAVLPFLFALSVVLRRKESLKTAFSDGFSDFLLILQTVGWNGVFNEISHFIVQRPRPFVFTDPLTRGLDPAHFVSFYSGHTSFSATVNVAVVLMLIRRRASGLTTGVWILVAETLVFSTAYFRILAGRHFLTDVLAGAAGGTAVALVVAHLNRRFMEKGPKLA